MKGFLALVSLCAVIIMANGNPFLASIEKYIEQEAKKESPIFHSQDVEQEAEVSNTQH